MTSSRPNSSNSRLNSLLSQSLLRLLTGSLLFLGLSLLSPLGVPTAFAQSTEASQENVTDSSHWRTAFDYHVAKELRQKPSLRMSHMKIVIEVATEDDDVNLSRTVGALLHVIENDPAREHRLMAVQALTTIGTDHTARKRYRKAMARLYALMQTEPSAQVRGVAANSLLQST